MQWSSESIAELASALAKAQIELVNPEKTMEATIYKDGGAQEGRTFKYASLASGLDIVRKTLGQHEIATVQTTAIDTPSQIVTLTTVLAHSSGEWIASDWPVCGVAETATPRRMGEALTYARRYALFTLVGIAGEDDMDAPDLVAPAQPKSGSDHPAKPGNGRLNGGARNASTGTHWAPSSNGSGPGRHRRPLSDIIRPIILPPDQSAALRDRLVAELGHLGGADEAAHWARRSLPQKARLTEPDEESVEQAFQVKLATLTAGTGEQSDLAPRDDVDHAADGQLSEEEGSVVTRHPVGIDKSVLKLPEPRRLRDRAHTRYVAKQPCLVCGRRPCDAHHLRCAQRTALGRKVSDEFTVPLCRGHHRELHRSGDEAAWWSKVGIDPTLSARKLWLDTHPLPMRPVEAVQAPSHRNLTAGLGHRSKGGKSRKTAQNLQNEAN